MAEEGGNMRRKLGIAFMCMGAVLLLGALALFGYNQWESRTAAKTSETLLEEMKLIMATADTPVPAPTERAEEMTEDENVLTSTPEPTIDPAMTVREVKGYLCIGYLTIPALDLELPVINRWSGENAQAGPCWYYGSTKTANMVICAHSYKKYFGRINQLEAGDEIIFTDMDGAVWWYEVVETEILQPTDIEKMIESEYALTLFSCVPDSPRQRVTVRCRAK